MGPEDIKFIRSMNHLSQDEMAVFLDCSRSRLSRLESGLLELTQEEWFKLKIQFPEWVARTNSNHRSRAHFNEYEQMLPNQYKDHGKIGFRFVSEFEKLIIQKLGHEKCRQFWKTEKVEPFLLKDKIKYYPYDLFLRMIQWLKLHGQLQTENQICEFAESIIKNSDWWGTKWNWFQETETQERFLILVESWASNTQNHIADFKYDNITSTVALKIRPKSFLNKELYFQDAIIGNFTGEWARAWCMSLLNKNATIDLTKKENSWILKIRMKKLH